MLTLLIGFGSVALIVSALHSVKKNAQQQNSPGNDLLQAPSLAAMRTYSATFLWAPFTVPYAMVHQAFPALTWLELAPWGVAASFCYITLGMVMNSYDLHPPTHVGAGTTSLQALWPLAGLLAFLGLIQGMIVEVTHLDLPRSLIVMAAPITLVWVSVQLNAPSIAVFRRLLMQRCRHIFSNVAFNTRTEISIGTVSAALGAVILTQLDLPSINQGLMASGWSVNLILISALLVQVALAWLGVNPFVTIYVAAHVLAQIEMLSHLHLVIALLELTVAAVVSGFGPWTLPMQMIANILNVRALTIAIYWNGRFSFCVLILTILLLILI